MSIYKVKLNKSNLTDDYRFWRKIAFKIETRDENECKMKWKEIG
jgi:hypothetical protein